MKIEKILVVLHKSKYAAYSVNQILAVVDLIKGVEVILVEDKYTLLEVLRSSVIEGYKAKVLGFSVLTSEVVDKSYREFITEALKLADAKGFITVAGGPHATGDPLDTLSLGFKYIFVGESEDSFREFIESLRDNNDVFRIKGIYTFYGGKPLFTGLREKVNLDAHHPFPFWRSLFNPIEITRGCPYGCWFCQVTYMHGCLQRHRSIDKILYYCNLMVSRGIRDLRFITPNAFSYGSSADRVVELLDKLHENFVNKSKARVFYGSFPSEVRPDYVDVDIVKRMKNVVSNKKIIIGAQSGSDKVLKSIRRGHSVDDVLNAVDTISRTGFTPIVDFIAGFPIETDDDLVETVKAMKKIVEAGGEIHMHYFIPLPGTPLAYRKARELPVWFKKETSRIIGAGKGYGNWMNQEKLSHMVYKYGLERWRRVSRLLLLENSPLMGATVYE